jgi:hypothetical protein
MLKLATVQLQIYTQLIGFSNKFENNFYVIEDLMILCGLVAFLGWLACLPWHKLNLTNPLFATSLIG